MELVAARTLALLWVTGVAYAIVFIAVWWSWYRGAGVRLAAPAVTLAWDGIFIAFCYRGRVPRWCVVGDAALAVGVAAGARRWLPAPVMSESDTWVFLTILGAATAAAWSIRSAWWVVVPVVTGGALALGTTSHGFHLAVSEALTLVVAFSVRFAAGRLRRGAGDADEWLAAARERQRLGAVAAARDRDRREQERILHDTVLNTLTGIGWGGAADDLEQARSRCAHSAAAVEVMLAGGITTTAGMIERIEEVVADATQAELDVTLSTGRGEPIGPAGGEVPTEVGEAVAAALGEALANVRLHAGTRFARVTVAQQPDGGFRVQVRDDGVGFDPRRRRPDRLGLRESVAGRLAEVGGWAEIRSRPGAGTTVSLCWRPGEPVEDVRRGRELSATAGRLQRDYAARLRRTVATMAAAWQVLVLFPLVAGWDRDPRPWLTVILWLLLVAAVTPAARISGRRALTSREAAGLVLVAITGALAMGIFDSRAADVARVVNWFGVLGVPVLLILVATSRPAREWVPAAILADAAVLSVALSRVGTDPVTLTRLFFASYGLWAIMIMVAAMGPVLRSTVSATARAAAAEAANVAQKEAALAVSRDRRRRYQHLEAETLPLLRGIVSQALDPRAAGVRGDCVTQAALLRRRLTTSAQPGHLSRLETAIEAAEARGVTVQVQLAGDLTDTPAATRTEIVDTVGAALGAVPDGPALLTVWCTGASGSAYVSFPATSFPATSFPATQGTDPLVRVTPSGTGLTEAHLQIDDGHACLEVHW